MQNDHEHLELTDIAALLGREEAPERFCRHLAAVCAPCGEQLRRVEALMRRFRHWNPEIVVAEGLVADGLLDALVTTDPASWASQVEQEADLQTWGVAWVALERARANLEKGEGQALELALLAAKIASHLGAMYHPEWVADLKALSHAAAALATPPSNTEALLREVGAALTALREGSGDEVVNREVVGLLAPVFGVVKG